MNEETKDRIKRMKEEFSKDPECKVFDNKYNYDGMLIQKGIPYSANCEHHRVAFNGEVSVGYIPTTKLIGLSKIGRIVEWYLNPTVYTLQEKATEQIIKRLDKELEPKGVMVVVTGIHTCIAYRGVKKPSTTITSAVRGNFADNEKTRQEFLSLIKE
jgi:GTP cyclohydrolase I